MLVDIMHSVFMLELDTDTSATTVFGTLTVDGNATLNGSNTIGNADTDTHTFNGNVDMNHDLNVDGNTTLRWNNCSWKS